MMSCGYDMEELGIQFISKHIGFNVEGAVKPQAFYTIEVCQNCRSLWLEAVKHWFEKPVKILSDVVEGSGIFATINGRFQEVSEKEWDRMYPGSIPLRVKKHE